MSVILFEDDRVPQLYPATIGRPAHTLACGGWRLHDFAVRLGGPIVKLVRPHLRSLEDAERPALGDATVAGPALALNSRLVPAASVLPALQSLLSRGEAAALYTGDTLAAALIPKGTQLPPGATEPADLLAWIPSHIPRRVESELPLYDFPHDLVRYHQRFVKENLEFRISLGGYEQHADGVFVQTGAQLGPYCVTKTTAGPILIDAEATIGPYCLLSGPVHVGAKARVNEHAALKDGVCLGHTTKIGGEVECSSIDPYTNKQHHGFLGHSYLGSWINLGAGTCNSDLKNTYGSVRMDYYGRRVETGMQFIGCIAGDYAKTAINTGIFTGKVIGVCSMVYGFVTTNVPSFVNYARLFGQVTEAPVEVMVATQARMFARRNVTQRPADIQLLHDMYELTRHERQLAGEPLAL